MTRTLWSVALLLGLAASSAAARQTTTPKKPGSVAGKLVGKLADSLVSGVAAGAIDSLLGDKVRGMLSSGTTPCAVRHPQTGAVVSIVQGGPAGPGAAIVSTAKEATGIKKPSTSAAPAPIAAGSCPAGSSPLAPGELQAIAAMSAGMPAPGAMPPGVPAMPSMGSLAAVTPVGMAASVAPGAIKGAKKLFGGGPMSAEDMAKGLARGRLELKGVKFLAGSDELMDGADVIFQQLAEVLGGFKAQFTVAIAPEAEKGVEPDVELAQRRVDKAMARLLAAGIPEGAIVSGGPIPQDKLKDGKYPKLGDAKLELTKVQKVP